ncbi:hypothetical protein Kpol_2002p29 [Vanderwaltozyma polyspora DSM 70294]|uniref:Mitochondrial inner membrane i-AAA protease complex subunit MGR1 n=1 Tax=Vanderwaltozyma polyspora (strain ATCC 22028 / DSM 70294 / BCRC 21397 / CBS 2163 / NBRC 10782 / NRRL Y-8283 / UCD 57-17) TaxID=436907 RepID=A7TFE5_VANPO|nr:uncharacterized protein Kpol_2002p29 [Vanderwaltozyma polyspora DSM 70294]EDO18959.1 hypothetical protein Kpol_2002p29 [Vanderwaltozyma polyspora DSM 70294]
MALYTPPEKSDNSGQASTSTKKGNEGDDLDDSKRFFVRPSIGLKMWGPLVPASDNRAGLWTLIGLQTGIGVLCMIRFRQLRKLNTISKNVIKKDIAEIPSLNRFSQSHGTVYVPKPMMEMSGNTAASPNSAAISNSGATTISNIETQNISNNNSNTIDTGSNDSNNKNNNIAASNAETNTNSPAMAASTTLPINTAAYSSLNVVSQGLNNKGFQGSEGKWRYSSSRSSRFGNFKSFMFFLAGSVVLFQSFLEAARMTLLKYDPWREEAKSVREKKFFNDIILFYHEGIDPTKIKVKDAASGNALSTNIPQVKQSVALVRAQAEAENPIIKWYGPLDYKPMSFNDFLDRLEFQLDMRVSLDNRRSTAVSKSFTSQFKHTEEELDSLINNNEKNRQLTLEGKLSPPKNNSVPEFDVIKENTKDGTIPLRGIVFQHEQTSPDDIDLEETWSLYNPWMNLALDTSLSIKFLPTVMTQDEIEGNSNDTKNNENIQNIKNNDDDDLDTHDTSKNSSSSSSSSATEEPETTQP